MVTTEHKSVVKRLLQTLLMPLKLV